MPTPGTSWIARTDLVRHSLLLRPAKAGLWSHAGKGGKRLAASFWSGCGAMLCVNHLANLKGDVCLSGLHLKLGRMGKRNFPRSADSLDVITIDSDDNRLCSRKCDGPRSHNKGCLWC